MMKNILIAGVVIAASVTLLADTADAFGGRGYARRQARRTTYVVAPVVAAPVVVQRVYAAPVVNYYRAPVYHHPHVPVHVGGYNSYYRAGYPAYGGGVSVRVGW